MINLDLALMDRLIKLVEVRTLRKRQIFHDHVEPIYSGLREIFNYYQETIEHLTKMIRDPSFSSEAVVAELRELRGENLDVRLELHKYLDVLIKEKVQEDRRLCEFIFSCVALLFCEPYSSDVVKIIARRSRLHGLEEDLSHYLEESDSNISTHRLFEKAVNSLSSQLDDAWGSVSNEYYKLRVEFLA